jgi:hypothetical protein
LAKNTFEPFPYLLTDPCHGLARIQHDKTARFFFRKREESLPDPAVETHGLTLDPVMPPAAFQTLRGVDIQNER